MMKGPIWVVAGALRASDGRWLMHRRPLEKHHGGLWEFPGGKVESTEKPVESLIRELHEELGIVVSADQCFPAGFAEEERAEALEPIVILLYKVVHWDGVARPLEGGRVEGFSPSQIANLDMPPLDQQLALHMFPDAFGNLDR